MNREKTLEKEMKEKYKKSMYCYESERWSNSNIKIYITYNARHTFESKVKN